MIIEIDAPEINGHYEITKGDNAKWYVTRYANEFRNGGQDCTEFEHPVGYSRASSAKRWIEKDRNNNREIEL
jgi:hypothetical protein